MALCGDADGAGAGFAGGFCGGFCPAAGSVGPNAISAAMSNASSERSEPKARRIPAPNTRGRSLLNNARLDFAVSKRIVMIVLPSSFCPVGTVSFVPDSVERALMRCCYTGLAGLWACRTKVSGMAMARLICKSRQRRSTRNMAGVLTQPKKLARSLTGARFLDNAVHGG